MEEKDTYGQTVLHGAVKQGRESILERLLRHGAEVNSRDLQDRIPLHVAATHGTIGVNLLLLEYGADEYALTEGSMTILHMAAANAEDQGRDLL